MLAILVVGFGILLSGLDAQPAPRVHGLFVGISRYRTMDKLAYCADDARHVAAAFQSLNGPLKIASGDATILTDSQASLAAVKSALKTIGRRLGPQDVFVFYFSGHGGGEDEPDIDPKDEADHHDETLVVWDSSGPHEQDLSDDQLRRILEAFPARTQIVLLDACFSGGFAADLGAPGRLVMTAAPEDHTSSVAFAHRSSGAFTHILLNGLQGEADSDSDGVVRTEEIQRHLRTLIPRYCPECGRRNPPRSTRCFYDKEPLATSALHPVFAGSIAVDLWNRPERRWTPHICATTADRSGCARNPAGCRCDVKGECGENGCVAHGRSLRDGCATPGERSICRESAELCPCPDYGNCGMSSCEAGPSPSCRDADDRSRCEVNAADCPCGSYGECEMASCRARPSRGGARSRQ
jgi:hypothetical protein